MAANETSKMCPHCYTPMKLKIAGYPMGSAFIKERVHVDIYSCPTCALVKLFDSDADMVTCPKCGQRHSAKEACPVCALNSAFDGSFTN